MLQWSALLEAFADIARLGQNCENATCEDGTTCFRKEGQREKYCKILINPGFRGCAAPHASCLQGNVCINDRCERGYERPVSVVTKVRKYPWWRKKRFEDDMFYTIAPMLVVGFLVFMIGILYALLFIAR